VQRIWHRERLKVPRKQKPYDSATLHLVENFIRRGRPPEEVEALLQLLAEFEQEDLELVIHERREAERLGQLH